MATYDDDEERKETDREKRTEDERDELAPIEEDERSGDAEYNPAVDPEKAKAWLNLLQESEKAFEEWNEACDNIEKLYANLAILRNQVRDKQFNLFWANLEILKPIIYAKPPVPVVVPKFKDRRPLYQTTSELLERCCTVAFDITRINDLLLLVRDDTATNNRGVAWCRYEPAEEDKDKSEYVCVDFKNRRDFLHSLSSNWREVTWVAAASYLTRAQARSRFNRYSGDEYQKAEYKVDKTLQELGGADNRERAKFWEIWHKGLNKVVWVADGCEEILDKADPKEIADLQNFFPCPQPAYGVCQPGSLVPVPDVLQYKDQLDEVNTLTGRLHALAQALEVKGFYPAGSAEIADAVETAVKLKSPGKILVPISNWAAFGGTKEVIIWLPIDMIASTITAIIAVRKQIIEDIYQIMGLSDIMRGASDPQETLGAQQIKSQYGSVRIRNKQGELVRLARDMVEITAELMCSEFSFDTMLEMSQMEIPTQQQQMMKLQQMAGQLQMMQQQVQQHQQMQQVNPQVQQQAVQQAPQQLQQMQSQFMQLMTNFKDEQQKPTAEQVEKFLRDYRSKTFVLDIETDSTIQADENAEKQRRGEFMGMMASLLPQLAALIAAEPGAAEFCGELLKFAVAPFRVGRTLDGSIDNLVEQIEMKSSQQQGNPKQNEAQQKIEAQAQIEVKKLEADKAKQDSDNQFKMQEQTNNNNLEQQKMANEFKLAMFEAQGKREENMAKIQQLNIKGRIDAQVGQQKLAEGAQKQQLNTQTMQQKQQDAQNRQADVASRRQLNERNQFLKERQAAQRPFNMRQ
jgi:hypothetical protein